MNDVQFTLLHGGRIYFPAAIVRSMREQADGTVVIHFNRDSGLEPVAVRESYEEVVPRCGGLLTDINREKP